MAADKIISVNPARATLGSLHPEITAGFLRQRNHIATVTCANNKLLRFLAGQSASKYNSIRSLILRLSGATAIGLSIFASPAGSAPLSPTLIIILISFLSVGLFTVPAAFALFLISLEGIFAFVGANALLTTPLLMCFCAAVIALFGPGKLSADNILYRCVRRHRKERRNRARSEEISYKAFRNMTGKTF